MSWERVAPLDALDAGPVLHKSPPLQVAVFRVADRVYAVDNRCPHEGYPLVEGHVAGGEAGGDPAHGQPVLTCNWHNWKFRLPDGHCLLGGDDVRSYAAEVRDDEVWVDLTDPPLEETRARILKGLRAAYEDRDYGRIGREIARLSAQRIDPVEAVIRGVEWSHDRFEYGMTHAFAATADWLALYDELADDDPGRLACLAEAVDHMAHDALRFPAFPFPEAGPGFEGAAFREAVEHERQVEIEGMVMRGLAEGVAWSEMRPHFAAAALAHVNDFGHSAIFVQKADELLTRLPEVAGWVVPALARSLAFTTREDLIPEFSSYGPALSGLPDFGATAEPPDAGAVFGAPVGKAVAWVVEMAPRHTPQALHDGLLEASARHLLHFDLAYDTHTHRPVSQNVGWLNLTHALTFGHAVAELAARDPSLWKPGLLQMACFVGRNAGVLDRDLDTAPWRVDDPAAFDAGLREIMLDHGKNEPIHACHILKTARAVQIEAGRVSPSCAAVLRTALNRFLHSPLKRKHALRLARQAEALVRRDFG